MIRKHIYGKLITSVAGGALAVGIPTASVFTHSIALAVPNYPLDNAYSYPPLNKICTDADIKKYAVESNKPSSAEYAFQALIACGSKAVPVLTKTLASKDENIRVQGAQALQSIGAEAKSAIPDLVRAFKSDPEENVRSSAIFALGGIGKDAVPALIAALQDPDPIIRRGATSALKGIGKDAKDAIPALVLVLKTDKDSGVHFSAASALGSIEPEARIAVPNLLLSFKDESIEPSERGSSLKSIGKDAVPALIAALQDPDPIIRRGATSALKGIGKDAKDAIQALVLVLKTDKDASVRSSAASALGRIEKDAKEAVPALVLVLKTDKDSSVRSSAAYALGSIGPEARNAVPDLVAVLKDKDKPVILIAITALGGIGKEAVPALVAALQDSDSTIRYEAANALRLVGKDAKEAVPALVLALKTDKDASVRSSAASALGSIGPEARNAVPDLMAALSEPNERLSDAAVDALVQIGKDAVPALIATLSSENRRTRIYAAITLGEIGSDAKAANSTLLKLFRSKDEGIRSTAALALAKIGPESAIVAKALSPTLIKLLNIPGKDLRANVLSALGNLGASPENTVPALIANLENPESASIRRAAAQSLIKIGRRAVPALIAALSHKSKIVSGNATVILGRIGKDAIPALILALHDPDQNVRYRAAFALGKVGEDAVPPLSVVLNGRDADALKAAAYALSIINKPTTEITTSLEAIVAGKNNSLEVRRVAASALQQVGVDMQEFFTRNKLLNPRNAACPTFPRSNLSDFEFDVFTGRCLAYETLHDPVAGGGGLIGGLCRFFGC